ncbi:MAG: hypothetical protein LBE38_07950 [Deltaproteobacteria bacterium]|jgi:hypothetical protein|nr:hypothetical protein [Deltaproteobacteria bacterium]
MKRTAYTLFLISIAILCLNGCAQSSQTLWKNAVMMSTPMGFSPVELEVPPFHLAGLIKKGTPSRELVVYLEGDGRAIIRGRPSADPTPRTSQSLELALLDPAPNILYLARIGQFLSAYAQDRYQPLWSERRLAPEVVEAASRAIDSAKAMVGASYIHIIGYSGGGGLAVLLAENRTDVLSLVTVAGLLDTVWWVETRGYKPLTGSLNPVDKVSEILTLPQIHFFGIEDNIIPPEMSRVYASKGNFSDLRRLGVPTNHYEAWTSMWSELLNNYVLPMRRLASQRLDSI